MNRTKIVGLTAIIALSIIALSIFASAFILPPVVSIGASPNPAAMSSTITAIGVDLSGSGISSVKIYENGNLVKQCPASSCAYLATHIIP